MGVVLKGFEEELNRPVVVKMLAPHLASSGAARKRFAREAQAAAVIVHPNVMPILTVNSAGRLPYLVMPYMACESLQQRIDREGPLEILDALRISHQVACGLAAAHSQGLVHRDVKPANILLERGVDRVMLTDFGLARAADDASLTRTGVIAGTPQFMSPEQARGEAVDARSDLFCLGSVMYVLCAGRPPFRAETSYGVLRRVTDEEPRLLRELNPAIPDWLESIISRLHSKSPADRFQSAEVAAEVLEQCLAHVQQPAVVPLPAGLVPSRTATRRSPVRSTLIRLASVAGAAAVCITLGFLINPGQPDSNPRPASTPEAALQTDAGASLPVPAKSPTEQDSTGSESGSPGEAWHGAVASGILELRSATDDLKASSRELWGIQPIGTAVNSKEDGQDGPSEGTSDTSSSSQETFESNDLFFGCPFSLFSLAWAGFLRVSDDPIAESRRLIVYALGLGDTPYRVRAPVWVVDSHFTKGDHEAFFAVAEASQTSLSEEYKGAPVVTTSGQLQGILTETEPILYGPEIQPEDPKPRRADAIPASVITDLLTKTAARPVSPENSGVTSESR